DRLYKRVPIGGPLDNFRLYVVDECGRILPPGVPGELWIAGFSVGRGYLNRPEKTAEVFIDNPFTKEPGYERIYRTGDIVRWTEDGRIDFVGRNDGQVKIRGFRIELTEVENVIREFEGVRDVTVQAFDAKAGGKFLAAYVAGDGMIDKTALCRFIGERKPPYMVPECIMQIDSIPLNQNQKVNKRALPEPVMSEETAGEEKERPMTRFEEEIAAVVKKTIGDMEISPSVSLTRYGLTSISAIGLVTTLADRFHVEIPVSKLLDGAGIVDIENLIFEEWMKQGFSMGKTPYEEASQDIPKETAYPLSSVQLAVYYDAMKREEDTLYNIPMCLAFESIDAQRLSDAVKAVVKAHGYINTHFAIIDGALSQVRNDAAEPEVPVLSMTESEFSQYRAGFVRPFNLNAGPLYRFVVAGCDDGKTYLLFDIHHLVFDGFSNGVLLKEIGRAYAGEALKPSGYTYFDYAKEDAALRESPAYQEAEAYYDGMFKAFEAPAEIPADRTQSAESGQLKEVYQIVLKETVDAFCRENGVTPSSFFLAVSFYVVSRFAGRRDVYLSTISSGREALKTHKLLGMFVHTLPLAMNFDKDRTVKELINASDTAMKNGIRHQSYPFAEIASKYGYTTEVMYECQIGMIAEGGDIGGEVFESIPMRLETPKFKVVIAVIEQGGEYGILIRYNDALYTKEYMETLAGSLKTVTEGMIKDASASVKTLSLLSKKEEETIEGFRQSAKAEIPEKLLHKVFEKQAKLHPDKTALIACDQTLSYQELNETANRVSWNLIERGVKRGNAVVLLLPRRSFYFAAMF
ncbi:MAG: AMP-binding protein, partial [Lachnospiraceae bacterium]|nr:AMP-binding protein [Lachnospiraceae bacterium]